MGALQCPRGRLEVVVSRLQRRLHRVSGDRPAVICTWHREPVRFVRTIARWPLVPAASKDPAAKQEIVQLFHAVIADPRDRPAARQHFHRCNAPVRHHRRGKPDSARRSPCPFDRGSKIIAGARSVSPDRCLFVHKFPQQSFFSSHFHAPTEAVGRVRTCKDSGKESDPKPMPARLQTHQLEGYI